MTELYLHIRLWWINYHIAIVSHCMALAQQDLHDMRDKRQRAALDLYAADRDQP